MLTALFTVLWVTICFRFCKGFDITTKFLPSITWHNVLSLPVARLLYMWDTVLSCKASSFSLFETNDARVLTCKILFYPAKLRGFHFLRRIMQEFLLVRHCFTLQRFEVFPFWDEWCIAFMGIADISQIKEYNYPVLQAITRLKLFLSLCSN